MSPDDAPEADSEGAAPTPVSSPRPSPVPSESAPVPAPAGASVPAPAPDPSLAPPAPSIPDLAPPGAGSWNLDVTAATLNLDSEDADRLFQALGDKLERILGRRAQIQRGGGMLRKKTRVDRIVVDAGDERLEAERTRTGPRFLAVHAVRGITLQTGEISAQDWLGRLVQIISAESGRSGATSDALGELLG